MDLTETAGFQGTVPGGDALTEEATAVRESGALGRSEILLRLFDYLASRSIGDRSPKETDIATQVFGRRPDFDAGQDAVVRVYIHKLRRKLEAIYSGPRKDAPTRLTIPLGDYRLVIVQEIEAGAQGLPEGRLPARPHWAKWAAAALSLVLAASAGTLLIERATLPPAAKELNALRAGPVWGPIQTNGFPTVIAVGDYYIFGESDDGVETNRLVREYNVNSRADLDEFVMVHPDKAAHYIDLDLRYLPVGSASALRDIVPMLTSDRNRRGARVILASELTPSMLKTNNVIYIGYLSGLGSFRDTVFAGSRFSVGETYDEIIDGVTKTRYSSQGGGPASDGQVYRDYGYLSTFRGPAGNQLVIIGGTRDVAVMQTAEAATDLAALKEVSRRSGVRGGAFEALYEVEGMNRQNVNGKLIVASPLDSARKWSSRSTPAQAFPSG